MLKTSYGTLWTSFREFIFHSSMQLEIILHIQIFPIYSNVINCNTSGGHGFICHMLKPQRKDNGVFTTLCSSKELIK